MIGAMRKGNKANRRGRCRNCGAKTMKQELSANQGQCLLCAYPWAKAKKGKK